MFRRIGFRPAQLFSRRHEVRPFSEKAARKVDKSNSQDVPSDPRPPWVYSTSAGLRFVLIPSILFYAVFFYDFGEREHVFMPPRRWLQRQRDAFFTISPEERKLIEESTSSDRISEANTKDPAALSES
ncbi:hypothetical protein BC834DRAFT_863376 [Gloeopeniophorella convolvens]|nr:hypothetical protein BC834DRAFT_863376 [Gloeopeniophorella convolvens]